MVLFVGLIDDAPHATNALVMLDLDARRARSRVNLFLLGDDLETYQERHPLKPEHLRLLRRYEEVALETAAKRIEEHEAFLRAAARLTLPRSGRLRG